MYENGVPSKGITFKPKLVNSIKTLKMGYAQTARQTESHTREYSMDFT